MRQACRDNLGHQGPHLDFTGDTGAVTNPDAAFNPHPALPQNPEFYRRVLDEWPSPVLVVNADAAIIYGNNAIQRLGGWDLDDAIGGNVLDYVHPDDVHQLAEAFIEIAGSGHADQFVETPWASIHTRLLAANGQAVPVVVTGAGGLGDPAVNGIIYDVRPTHEQDILRRGLTGLAQGEPIDSILQLITNMISLPPLELDAAVLEPRGDGTYRIIGATSATLQAILIEADDPQPWNEGDREPQRTRVSQYPGGVGEDLFAAGYREFWHISPEGSNDLNSYRIVACGKEIVVPATGQLDRLSRASELASVVLLRARADAELEHSATHDRLTQLPNRGGFHRYAVEALEASNSDSAAMLFIDLDGFKEVNDAHGHAAGDTVLRTVATRLESVTRSIDIVGRLGGDEFAILLGASRDRPANYPRVQAIADRTLQELRREIDIGDENVTIAASIGAVIAPAPTALEALLAQADVAMYEAKRKGGNRHNITEL